MGMTIWQVDAFTNRKFGGNPAGVCVLDQPGDAEWMQLVAREMNLSETAFLFPQGSGYNLRWFTPMTEVELCGHATVASAHILWSQGILDPESKAVFYTLSGVLSARKSSDDWIEVDFPQTPAEPSAEPKYLLESLNVATDYIGKTVFDYLVEVESEETVRAMAPDFTRLSRVKTRGVIVTSRASTPGFDFVSRFFAPAVGINEDPVTGSAHCCLGPYWQSKLKKNQMTAYQASNRGGVIRLQLSRKDRITVSGQAVTVMRGELL